MKDKWWKWKEVQDLEDEEDEEVEEVKYSDDEKIVINKIIII